MTGSSDKLAQYQAGEYSPTPFPYVSPYTFFHEAKVAEFTPLIELDSSHGLSPAYRDKINTTGSGSVTHVDGEHLVSSGTTAGSTATLATQERGRYQPGIEGLAGHAVRRPTPMTGDQEIFWEYGDGIDGARIGEDGTGVFVQLIQYGTERPKIYQGDWNGDNLNGEGGHYNWSGLTLDLAKPNIWRTPYNHYGIGPAAIEVYALDDNGFPNLVRAHTFGNPGDRMFWEIPRLPLREYASNGTTGGDVQLYVGGRQFAVLGRYEPNRRQTTDFFEDVSVGATLTPLISFQKKTERKFLSRSVKVSGVGILTDENLIVEIVLGGSLTGAAFSDIDGIPLTETAVQSDVAATAIANGVRIDGIVGAGGQGNRSNLSGIRGLGVDIPDDVTVTLAARSIGGTATVNGAFSLEEEA